MTDETLLRVLEPVLRGRRSQPHLLIEALEDTQGLCGYVPEKAMSILSRELGVPLIEVWRVANFYKAFSLTPQGKHVFTVCTGTACHVRGANPLLDQIRGQLKIEPGGTTKDGLFSVESVNCLGACALGPVVVLDDVYHHHMTPHKLHDLIEFVRETHEEEVSDGPTEERA